MVIERLQQFIEAKGLNVSAFEKSVGLGNATFASAVKRGGTLGSDKLENILMVYPELNPTWLMTGKGDMFGGIAKLEEENERLKEDIRRLREIKSPNVDAAPVTEVWLRFMENQKQYNEIMREMADIYIKLK